MTAPLNKRLEHASRTRASLGEKLLHDAPFHYGHCAGRPPESILELQLRNRVSSRYETGRFAAHRQGETLLKSAPQPEPQNRARAKPTTSICRSTE